MFVQDCGRQLSDRADELCYPLLGVLLCLSCHQRRVSDTMMSAVTAWQLENRGVWNPTKMSDIGFLKTEPTSKFKNRKLGLRGLVFRKLTRRFGYGFSRCLIHNSSCSMIGSTVKVFFFVTYLCTSSSESVRLTVSWINSARKYVISSVIHTKQNSAKTEPNKKLSCCWETARRLCHCTV